MSARFSRSKLAGALVVGAAGGVLLASSFDLTKYGFAQSKPMPPVAQAAVRGPNSPDAAGSFANVAERVTPTVVAINTVREARAVPRGRGRQQVPPGMEEFMRQFGGQAPQQPQQQEMRGEGSGFIVSADGYIITNNHVVADADRVNVTLSDRRSFSAKVIGRDSTTDVAVVKIDAKDLPTLPIGNEENARIGDWVLAVGNPLGLDFTVTAGIISAKSRGGTEVQLPNAGQLSVSDFIQTDAAINPGNSGGPLINLKGEAIGLNSAIASETGYYSGYGFAIPITLVKQVADALIKDGRVRLPVMGVSVQVADADAAAANKLSRTTGVIVQGFNPANAGPAKEAGILVGDLIVAIAGVPIDRVSTLQRIVRSHAVGEVVSVDVLRYGDKKTFKVKLTELEALAKVASAATRAPDSAVPAAPVSHTLTKVGVAVEAVPAEQMQQLRLPGGNGVRVTEVAAGSPARDKLNPGIDFITDVLNPGPRRPVKTVQDLQAAITALKAGDVLSVMVTSVFPGGQGQQSRVVNLRAY
jgi:serine protease Do